MSICYITAYYDINRSDWKEFGRTNEDYFKHFQHYINLFSNPIDEEHNMIVFIDEKHYTKLSKMIEEKDRCRIIPIIITNEWMNVNLPMWKYLNKERDIMNSDRFKNLIPDKLHFPEHKYPEYTLINHCKIDFINYALTLSHAEYFCWTDFGYFATPERCPLRLLDINKLIPNKINYTLINPLTEYDKDPIYTLFVAPERIGGFFFFGDRKSMKEYQILYHSVLEYYQNVLYIADDDQALVLFCYYKKPYLFHLHYLGGWHRALSHFQNV